MDEYPRHPEILKEGIKAVFGFMDPPEYQRDLQIVIDAVLHHGAISDDTESVVLRERGGPQLPLYFSGPDLLYVNEWHRPRFGSGMYQRCLQHLYTSITGGEHIRLKLI